MNEASSKPKEQTDIAMPAEDLNTIAAELAALGEDDLDECEAHYVCAAIVQTGELSQSVPTALDARTEARVWRRLERRWWQVHLIARMRSIVGAASDMLRPRHLAWAGGLVATLVFTATALDHRFSASTQDDELAALGAIARSQLESFQEVPTQANTERLLPTPRWTQALMQPANEERPEL
jgi:hypothetical protein